jgi:hypothetical protein
MIDDLRLRLDNEAAAELDQISRLERTGKTPSVGRQHTVGNAFGVSIDSAN